MPIYEGYSIELFFIAYPTQLNQTYVILLELCSLSAKKEALPPSTPAPAREAKMLPDIQDASNQILVKKMLGTTKSQLCRKMLLSLLLNTPAGLAVSAFQIFPVLGKQQFEVTLCLMMNKFQISSKRMFKNAFVCLLQQPDKCSDYQGVFLQDGVKKVMTWPKL